MMLDALIAGLGIEPHAPEGAGGAGAALGRVRICDITEDSRTVMPGSLFIARRGQKADGRAYVAGAARAGAVAVLSEEKLDLPAGVTGLRTADVALATAQIAERFFGEPSSRLRCVGVTGTNGKTTVAFLVHQLLNGAGLRCGMMGTVSIDDGSRVTPASLTTPPALEISRTLAKMVECGCRAMVMEASSHALDQRRTAGVKFGVGVFTNLTHDHLDYHGTMDAYAGAKRRLFESLPGGSEGGVAVVNVDDPAWERVAGGTEARLVRCTMRSRHAAGGATPEMCAVVTGADATGTTVTLSGEFGTWAGVRLPLLGAHNVMNAMQACAAAMAAGAGAEAVRGLIETVHAPPGRLEPVETGRGFAVYVDYAHSDDALERIIKVSREAVKRAGRGRVTVVFGCGGDRDKAKRPKMGRLGAALADRAIFTSDNPRSEDAGAILDQMLAGVEGADRGKVTVIADRAAAIARAVEGAEAGDIVLVAGKGHEDYQIVPDGRGGTRRVHFDDREAVRGALARLAPTVVARPRGAERSA